MAPIFKDAMVNEYVDNFPSVFIEEMLNVWNRHVVANEQFTDCQFPLGSWLECYRLFRQNEILPLSLLEIKAAVVPSDCLQFGSFIR